jgi:hypothetical protein
MQLTNGLEYQPLTVNDLPTTTSSYQHRPVPLSVTVADQIQVDFIVSTGANQPDVRVTLPVATDSQLSNLNTQQSAIASAPQVHTWPTHTGDGVRVGTTPGVLRQESTIRGWR